jgi:hypothetical protein
MTQDLAKAAQDLLDKVARDSNTGGLVTQSTIQSADALRRALNVQPRQPSTVQPSTTRR